MYNRMANRSMIVSSERGRQTLLPQSRKGETMTARRYPQATRRKRSAFKPLVILLTLLLAFALTVAASSLIKADRLMKLPSEAIPPYAVNMLPSFQSVSFTSGGQITLKGWLIKADREPARATVLLVHDQGGNRLPFGLETLPLIKDLSRQGFYTLAFDLRHSGESGGGMSSFGYAESEDVASAIQWVMRQRPGSPLVLYGFGSGTTAIMRALQKLETESRQTDDLTLQETARNTLLGISAAIFDSPARDSDAYIRSAVRATSKKMAFWLPQTTPYAIRLSVGRGEKQDHFAHFTSMTLPVLILGHQEDSLLDASDVKPLIEERLRLHPQRTSLYQAPGSGHLTAYLEDPAAYTQALEDFLGTYLP